MRLKIVLTIFLIIFLFGCLEPTRNELNLCFTLSSKSYTNVPDCISEADCYSYAERLFDSQHFSYEQQSRLYTLKNYLARSWYFFNLGEKEIDKISQLCKSGNTTDLPGTINQARFYLDSAFGNIDFVMKESFEIISQEKTSLEENDINLVKEEALYSVFIETQQIISELESGQTNSGTYVSYYFSKINDFEKVVKNKSFSEVVEKTPVWLTIYQMIGGNIITQLNEKKELQIPILGTIFQNSIAQIQSRINYNDSISALIDFPLYDLMKLYSDTGGTNDSSLKRFSDLMRKASQSHASLEKNRTSLWENFSTKLTICENLSEKTRFAETLPLLKARIGAIETDKDNIEALSKLKQKYVSLKELVSKHEISLGFEVSELKDSLNQINLLEQKMVLSGEGIVGNMAQYCNQKATELDKLDKTFESKELQTLWENIKFYSTKTLKEAEERKLIFCEKMIEQQDFLSEAEENYDVYHAKKIDSTADCFKELDGIFKYYPLYELQTLFETLKKTEVTEENLYFFEDSCKNILNQAKNELESDESIKKIIQFYSKLSTLEPRFLLVCAENQNYEKYCEKLHTSLINYSKYFENGAAKYVALLPILDDLQNSIELSYNEHQTNYETTIIDFVKTHSKIIVLSEKMPETNTLFESKNRFLIENPFESIEQPISLKFETNGKTLIDADDAISDVLFETGIVLLDHVPKGFTKFDYTAETIIKTTEETKIISASNTKSIYQRTITIDSEKTLPSIVIKTIPPSGTTKIIPFINEDEVLFSESPKVSFIGKDVSNKTLISVLFYVINTISLTKTYLFSTPTGTNTDKIHYSIEATNNTSEELQAVLLIPIETVNTIEKIELFNENGDKQKINIYDTSFAVPSQNFRPRETKKYSLIIYTNNIGQYYTSVLEEIYEKLYSFGEVTEAEKAKRLINAEYTTETKKEVEAFILAAEKLIQLHEKDFEEKQTLITAKLSLEQKINELTNLATQLEENGFYDESENVLIELSKSKRILESGNITEIGLALETLSKYSFTPSELITSKGDDMWQELQKIMTTDTNLTSMIALFFEKKERLDELFSDPLKMKTGFNELQEIYYKIISQHQLELDKSKTEETLLQLELDKLFINIEQKISFLEKELSVSESDLIKAKFIQPITLTRIKKIGLEISKIKESSKSLVEKKSEAIGFLNELDDAIDSIKIQAINKFNQLVDLGAENNVLSKGKELIDSNNFTSALLILNSDLSSNKELPTQLLSFIPILIILLVAFILKTKVSQRKGVETKKQEKVLNDWDD
jgi:hypothetical protein